MKWREGEGEEGEREGKGEEPGDKTWAHQHQVLLERLHVWCTTGRPVEGTTIPLK